MEKQHRIKDLILKRKDGFLTALEKNWRDWALKPLTNLFQKIGITANQITYAGFILIFFAIWLYFSICNIKWQLIVLAIAALTDAIDGPTARNNDNVTVKGVWLDHIRDGVLAGWVSYLIYINNLLSAEILIIVLVLQILLVWICLKDFLIHYLKNISDPQTDILIENFSLDNLQTSILGRLQFFFWIIAYGFLFLSMFFNFPILIIIGQALIVLEIIFAGLNILESYQKSLSK